MRVQVTSTLYSFRIELDKGQGDIPGDWRESIRVLWVKQAKVVNKAPAQTINGLVQTMIQPCVYIVGAGPGDPDLLTVKAARLIAQADAVVYDKLVSQPIIDLIPKGCNSINVGKASGHHPIPQQEINNILIDLARDHKMIVRLKGGDPLVFGRGGEEALELYDHRINFSSCPE